MFGKGKTASTTPKSIHDGVARLCKRIDPTQQPIYVKVVPDPQGRLNQCFDNVKLRVKSDGGSAQLGWTIWEEESFLIQGEFHAVWRMPNGDLLDITPKIDGEDSILFLPDSCRSYEDVPIDNIRMAISDSGEAKLKIRFEEESFILKKRYFQNGNAMIPIKEMERLSAKFGMCPGHKDQCGPYDRCPCGSGKNFKFCCIEIVRSMR